MVSTREQYDIARRRGVEPLLGDMDIRLRVEVQREVFGRGHGPKENGKFYKWCWEHKGHYCEECMKPLGGYSAVYVSHILTRGAYPEMAHDPRNVNILCFRCHSEWENGKRGEMRIYRKNQLIIEQLKNEYGRIDG